jgi:predicted DNA-binding transcriptional regulator AlpA
VSALQHIMLDYNEAARLLCLSRSALRDLVYKRRGPATVRIGRRTMFAYRDLETWVDAHRKAVPPLPNPEFPKRKRGRPSIADKIARGEL